MPEECIFCQIVAGDLPASVVHEDDQVLAFLDIGAVSEGHALVIPKEHVRNLYDLDAGTAAAVFSVAAEVARAIRDATKCEGMDLLVANEEAAGQVIFHLHAHLIPRNTGDDFALDFHYKNPPREELDAVAARIRGVLGT